MNKSQFISYIESPDKLSANDSVLLNDVLKTFPFFQTAHLLYAKSLHNQNSIHYNNQLKITASYATDRKVLHRLITKQKNREVDFIVSPTLPKIVEVEEEKEVDSLSEKKIEIFIKPKKEEEEVLEEKAEIIETPAFSPKEEKKIETVKEIEESIEKREIKDATEELEKEYFTEAINASYEIEILNMELVIQNQESIQIEEKEKIEEKGLDLNEEVKEKKGEQNLPKEEPKTIVEPNSFTDWLKHLKGDGEFAEPEVDVDKKTDDVTESSQEKKFDAFELIDRFIKEEPKMARPKAEFYNPVNMAKQSVAEDISFVSETLAKIYVLQGNYSRALQAYENLHLKYPEKRLYFAAQIKNLRKLINQQNNK